MQQKENGVNAGTQASRAELDLSGIGCGPKNIQRPHRYGGAVEMSVKSSMEVKKERVRREKERDRKPRDLTK